MSLLSRERLQFALRPDGVEVMRLRGGLRPTVLYKRFVPCEAGTGAWDRPVEALAGTLSRAKARGLEARVVLSSAFVRYTLVPWSDKVFEADERRDLARICFETVYGSLVHDWDVRVSETGYGRAAVASAVDSALLAAITTATSAAGVRLASLEPYLMTAFNRFRARFGSARCRFVIAESGRVLIATFRDRNWHSVRSFPARGDLPDELSIALQRELHAEAGSAGKFFVFAPHVPSFELPPGLASEVELLSLPPVPGFSLVDDAACALAVTGAAQ